MGKPAAKQNDSITATDVHDVVVDGSATPQSLPHPFNGRLDNDLSRNVYVNGQAAATKGSGATNSPPHTPTPPGKSFVNPPGNRGVIIGGSGSGYITGRSAARDGDSARTCADPAANTTGSVNAAGNVYMGS